MVKTVGAVVMALAGLAMILKSVLLRVDSTKGAYSSDESGGIAGATQYRRLGILRG